MKTHIVMPIGVSQPGTPILKLLEYSIKSILEQTSKDFIFTVAADENISDECKQLLKSLNVNIKWFPVASFFRKGGIWKKITETWKDESTKYLAFMHYDDFWDKEKLLLQIEAMEKENLNSSWSETYVIDIDNRVISNDCAYIENFNNENRGYRSVAQAHSMIVNREKFFNSGIMEYQDKWSPVFEDLFIVYCNKIGNGRKVNFSRFYWRNHSNNMTNSILSNIDMKETLDEQRLLGTYNEVDSDAEYMNEVLKTIINECK